MKRKTEWISFRVSKKEKRSIKKLAKKRGQHVGELMRDLFEVLASCYPKNER